MYCINYRVVAFVFHLPLLCIFSEMLRPSDITLNLHMRQDSVPECQINNSSHTLSQYDSEYKRQTESSLCYSVDCLNADRKLSKTWKGKHGYINSEFRRTRINQLFFACL
jgi:hypothetical protein